MGCVDGREGWCEHAGLGEQLRRCETVRCETLFVLAGLFRHMCMHRTVEGAADDLDRFGIDRSDGVDGGPDRGKR